ncbi:MarR family winged helix-turn-helix transcriptional regulator [Blastomonas sp.]|uniref:MarR family winged helix-turn-helix transcriptional regulator n=1 Tax=Blastomonas sp. TaxID=1909299 RepID=UPI0026083FCC|nr:MarR family transcriptional regulator [Blastomonas sp.]MDM7955700.1 MarR family transcriptional regulator [Blastomonas sp.]
MTGASAIREKHDGEMVDRSNVRLWLRLLTCTTVIEKRLKRRFADQYGITLPRFDVMAALDRNPAGMTMGQLSQELLVSNGNVTGVVQTLARDNYISIAPSPTDGRASIVRLTQLGRECFTGIAEAHHEWIDMMLEGLTRDQRAALYDLLGALKISLADDKGKEQP